MREHIKKLAKSNKIIEFLVLIGYLLISLFRYLLFTIFLIFKIDDMKVVFSCNKGLRYGDNPRYISEALAIKRPEYKIIWLLDKDVNCVVPSYVKRVPSSFLHTIYELSTSKVWVDSNTKEIGTRKRKGQLFLFTMHGSYGLKKIGLDLGKNNSLHNRLLLPFNSRIANIMLSNSYATSAIYRRAFNYKGRIIEKGSPKNDIFFQSGNEINIKVKNYYKLPIDSHLIMYAPTFRDDMSYDFFNIDLKNVLSAIKETYSGEWYFLVRVHPQNSQLNNHIVCSEKIINSFDYSDMQELLMATDILITDYSSCMFDFITKPKPCFIYAPDLEDYESKHGNYYKMSELPFPVAGSNNELINNIKNFDIDNYIKAIEDLHKNVGLCETGNASEKVADAIIDFIESHKT
ncbi:CDP-glycerol glycerophosphotransferase family protein [Butyrivibrio sp. XPD2006]|uniref:CDP-glycerol glycerophosphotransferase family protein n=1 Tax=Butyrivibrio sp. XPD2006 TaxID=1280668 RepID=UPI0003B44067|nr:CDP-glycerol glycerophosphotransferase family protein [Butyrivibrio sp. XPD2006]